jgi:hypothetical protein
LSPSKVLTKPAERKYPERMPKISISKEAGALIIATRDLGKHATLEITHRGGVALLAILERVVSDEKDTEAECMLTGELTIGGVTEH